ncbi:MAG: DUF4037 domain-containing protein [Bifidobacterium sp.]|uniref:DUF4037 domain-containing protein n=3 Tax=Bifidobacterium TaxID=1678 RepID=A0AB39UKK2_9BIFI
MGKIFDVDEFLGNLDGKFMQKASTSEIASYLDDSLERARSAGERGGELTVLNEMIGFNRSRALHDRNAEVIPAALKLADSLDLAGTPAWVATLINAATGYRAAGDLPHAEAMYVKALAANDKLDDPNVRETAALHNNLSMAYSDIREFSKAETQLKHALDLLESLQGHDDSATASTARDEAGTAHLVGQAKDAADGDSLDVDIASTHTNLALVLLAQHRLDEAQAHSSKALIIYEGNGLTDRAHYASALACQGQVLFGLGHYRKSVEHFEHALELIEERFGKSSDYYNITEANYLQARSALADSSGEQQHPSARERPASVDGDPIAHAQQEHRHVKGLDLSRAYWEEFGKTLIHDRFSQYQSRIAVGLVGHGSQCLGFDDELSQDHDFGPGFCIWLTDSDFAMFGQALQKEYDRLPRSFMGFGPAPTSVRAHGADRRFGVFSIGNFFEGITGLQEAPGQQEYPLWLSLDEATLAAATSGEIFADPEGTFSRTRQGFTFMPDDVRLSLISKRLGMMSQSGQYNIERMALRNDWPSVWLSTCEFVRACSSLIFLVNNPISAGYLPYYKWNFAALRRLSSRMGMVLRDVPGQLEELIAASSAIPRGPERDGASMGRPIERMTVIIDSICRRVADELRRQGLTDSTEDFLEWQRPYIEAHIRSKEACLHSL